MARRGKTKTKQNPQRAEKKNKTTPTGARSAEAKGSSSRKTKRRARTTSPPTGASRDEAGRDRRSPVQRIGHAITQTVKKLAAKLRGAKVSAKPDSIDAPAAPRKPAKSSTKAPAKRAARRVESDIPPEILENAYIPHQTSLKASFRTDGSDQQKDQEFAGGFADERFNDEDHFTNKSGDPRIGTHGRSHEPAEQRTRR